MPNVRVPAARRASPRPLQPAARYRTAVAVRPRCVASPHMTHAKRALLQMGELRNGMLEPREHAARPRRGGANKGASQDPRVPRRASVTSSTSEDQATAFLRLSVPCSLYRVRGSFLLMSHVCYAILGVRSDHDSHHDTHTQVQVEVVQSPLLLPSAGAAWPDLCCCRRPSAMLPERAGCEPAAPEPALAQRPLSTRSVCGGGASEPPPV